MKKAAIPKRLLLSPRTTDHRKAAQWLTAAGNGGTDGVIAKRLDDRYTPGERTMIKVKRFRTADCVVGGFRYASNSRQVGSLLLGLYDADGKLDHVGFTSTITDAARPALTRKKSFAACRDSRAKHLVVRVGGAPSAAANGSHFGPSL
jgi:ATP-dependent DNA ligase